MWLYRGTVALPIRLASWAIVAIPVAFLLDPIWIPVAIVGVEVAWIAGLQWGWFLHRRKERLRAAAEDTLRLEAFAAFGVGEDRVVEHADVMRSVWRGGDLMFKPAPSPEEWRWLGEQLPTVREDGFRLALPVPATDGRWVVDGWCAQTWVAGVHPRPARWLEVLAVCDRFHRACAHLPRPGFVDARTHNWAVGDRVAWEEVELESDGSRPERLHTLERLLALRRPVSLPSQVIHGDLSDNVLFADEQAPAVIDPTPYWRPAGFASAIVVHDAVQWFDAEPAPLIAATAHLEAFPQLFVRAAIFRTVTSYRFGTVDPIVDDRIVDLAVELAG